MSGAIELLEKACKYINRAERITGKNYDDIVESIGYCINDIKRSSNKYQINEIEFVDFDDYHKYKNNEKHVKRLFSKWETLTDRLELGEILYDVKNKEHQEMLFNMFSIDMDNSLDNLFEDGVDWNYYPERLNSKYVLYASDYVEFAIDIGIKPENCTLHKDYEKGTEYDTEEIIDFVSKCEQA